MMDIAWSVLAWIYGAIYICLLSICVNLNLIIIIY